MTIKQTFNNLLLVFAAALTLSMVSTHASALGVEQLKCEYLTAPLGIDTPEPRLSWVLISGRRGERQTAYQVLVAGSEQSLDADHGDLWDSGKVGSARSAQVVYAGKPMRSGLHAYWKVRVWDRDGRPSAYSLPAWWEMGLLAPEEWHGRWIGAATASTPLGDPGPAPLLRRPFMVHAKVRSARVYVCGLGYYELHLNGRKVGDHLLDPGYTAYDRRALYVTYDITSLLKRGRNALGAMLGTGWYDVHTLAVWNFDTAPWRAAPQLLLEMRIEYADGRREILTSDAQWKRSTGPIVFDSIYGGENYDARLRKPGWDSPDYDDSGWQQAVVTRAPRGRLQAQQMPPIRVDRVLTPVKLTEPKPGVFVYDMGQNFTGFPRLIVQGPAGATVVLRCGERLHPDGTLDTAGIAVFVKQRDPTQQYQTDTYTLKGSGVEVWQPRFTYQGFQYVEMTGFPGRPTLDNLRGVFIHTALKPAGQFSCSNPLLNRIQRNTLWSYLSNLESIPTDCPHREKNGWTGDAQLAAEQGIYNFDGPSFYTKWLNDLEDAQKPDGELPGIVPTSGWGYGTGPAWDSAIVLIPWYLHAYYGDTRILQEHYAAMRRLVDYLTTRADHGIVSYGLGDWAPFDTDTPAAVTSTGYYYRDALIVSKAAGLLGKADDARKYADLAAGIKAAFNARFYHSDTGSYANGSQTALSCALYQGLVEPENRERALQDLVTAISKRDNHLDCGILGTKYVMNVLLDDGRADVAYRIATQRTLPSWGWWIGQGATTLWESWRGGDSRNHIMFGDVSAWFYKALAGIRPDSASPGFAHFFIQPEVLGDLTVARAQYDSIHGRIVSDWKLENGLFTLNITIPVNTTATVFLPAAAVAKVTESGKPAQRAEGVRFVGMKGGAAVFNVGSGAYQFAAPH